MTGTITYILSRAGYRAMNGPLADERRRLAGAEPPAAYVSYDHRLLAGAGWYGYRIAIKGGDRQMLERARYMLAERYVIRDGYEYYADGVYVFGVLLRERVKMYGIGGGAEPGPSPIDDWLNFTMPNGGTITLTKNGSPTEVTLEYLIEGEPNWVTWTETNNVRSLTLDAGGKVYIRNASELSSGFSTAHGTDFYNFDFSDVTYANGNTNSLLCKNPQDAVITDSCFTYLYRDCGNLKTASSLPSTTLADSCYWSMFAYTGIEKSPLLPASIIPSLAYRSMFYGSVNMSEIKTYMTDISSYHCIEYWCSGGVSETGDFYCPAELTIPSGSSGIPSGWTRHDI